MCRFFSSPLFNHSGLTFSFRILFFLPLNVHRIATNNLNKFDPALNFCTYALWFFVCNILKKIPTHTSFYMDGVVCYVDDFLFFKYERMMKKYANNNLSCVYFFYFIHVCCHHIHENTEQRIILIEIV